MTVKLWGKIKVHVEKNSKEMETKWKIAQTKWKIKLNFFLSVALFNIILTG